LELSGGPNIWVHSRRESDSFIPALSSVCNELKLLLNE
jgi:hypothetical protein